MSSSKVMAQLQSLSDTYNVSKGVRKRKAQDVYVSKSSSDFMKRKRTRKRRKIVAKELKNQNEREQPETKKIKQDKEEEEESGGDLESTVLTEIREKEKAKDWTNINMKILEVLEK